MIGAFVAALARAALLLYPRSFRREVGAAVIRDIRQHTNAVARARGVWAAWLRLPAILASLAANGAGVDPMA